MIYGRTINRKAVVPVIFPLPQQPDFSVNFVSHKIVVWSRACYT
jgi:predicted aspartyl protease